MNNVCAYMYNFSINIDYKSNNKVVGFIFVFPTFNELQRMLTPYNELLVITRKTSWPLKPGITDFYCNRNEIKLYIVYLYTYQ